MAISRYRADQLVQHLAARCDQTPFWTPEDAADCLNEAMALYNLLTGYWKTQASLLTAAVTTYPTGWRYTLPAALTYGMRVAFNNVPLTSTGLWDLDNGRPNWRTETTTAGGDVPTVPTLWAPLSLTTIVIWPAHTAGGGTLLCDGIAATPYLTTPNIAVDLDETGLAAVLDMALHLLSFSEGSDRFSQTLSRFHQFLRACAEKNGQLEASAWYRRYLGLDRQKDFRPTRAFTTGAATVMTPQES
jgi:hypothetical protein